MSSSVHRATAPTVVTCAAITISDTRTEATDTSGRLIVSLLQDAGHRVASRTIVPDDTGRIRSALDAALAEPGVQAVLTTGGTGITSRDSTYEVVTARLEKTLDGFGELFRALSYEEIGAAAMMSRACAGLVAKRIVIAMPGSEAAVRLAMTRLVLPELGHLVREASR
jgi:molybdenum cofactor biosynthesis protein B